MKKFILSFLVTNMLFMSSFYSTAKASTLDSFKITDHKGNTADVFNSSDTEEGNNKFKTSASVSFIEDPNNSDLTALIKIEGFIPSQIKRTGDYYWGRLYWPSKYSVTAELKGENDAKDSDINTTKARLIQTAPNNQVETVKINETVGYTIGGSISNKKEDISANGSASYNVQQTISYTQEDFKTIQTKEDLTKTSWDIEFNGTKQGYNKNSYNAIYGNELFMKTRIYNEGRYNFLEDSQLSSLISGGFSPSMIIAVSVPKEFKDEEKTKLVLNYSKYEDIYKLSWSGLSSWWGENIPYTKHPQSLQEVNHTYTIDWKNHKISIDK